MEKTTPAPVSCSGVIEKTMIIHHHNTDESDCTGDIKSDESRSTSTRGTFGVMNISSHLSLYPVNAINQSADEWTLYINIVTDCRSWCTMRNKAQRGVHMGRFD